MTTKPTTTTTQSPTPFELAGLAIQFTASTTQSPTPFELVSLAVQMGQADRAGMKEALQLCHEAEKLLNPAGQPDRTGMEAALSLYREAEKLLKTEHEAERMKLLKPPHYYTRPQIMEALDIRAKGTLETLVKWGVARYPPKNDEARHRYQCIWDICTDELGATWAMNPRDFELLKQWQHEKASEQGQKNRLSASKPRRKKPVK